MLGLSVNPHFCSRAFPQCFSEHFAAGGIVALAPCVKGNGWVKQLSFACGASLVLLK